VTVSGFFDNKFPEFYQVKNDDEPRFFPAILKVSMDGRAILLTTNQLQHRNLVTGVHKDQKVTALPFYGEPFIHCPLQTPFRFDVYPA